MPTTNSANQSNLSGVLVNGKLMTQLQLNTAKSNEPFAYNLALSVDENRLGINFVWTLVAGYLVMFMQAGFALVETGLCRAKNAGHTMAMNFMIYGLGKTHVQHVLTAVAINLVRIDAVLTLTPLGTTRRSNFARLVLHPSLQDQAAA